MYDDDMLFPSSMCRELCSKTIQPPFTAQRLLGFGLKDPIYEVLAFNMEDVRPVENIRSIVKEMAKFKEPKKKAHLKTVITRVWRNINTDKELCKRLMQIEEHPLQTASCNCQGGQASLKGGL